MRVVILFLLLCAGNALAQQQAWPTKTVRLIVPFAAAGPVDFSTRLVANKVSEQVGQTFIVDNRPGASGNIGASLATQALPDGYTFLVTGVGPLAINPHLFSKVPFNVTRDFVPVVTIVQYPQVLAVSPSVPVQTIGELIALAKAQPGKLNYGSAGVGTSGHLITESLLTQAGIKMTHIPFKGGSTTTQGLLTGEVDVVIDGLPSFMSQGPSGRIRVLAVSTAERWPLAPNLPTVAEGASLPGFDFSSWVMFVAPTNTPHAIVERFAAEVDKALKDEGLRQRLRVLGALPRGGSPTDARKFLTNESEKWKKIVHASGARID